MIMEEKTTRAPDAKVPARRPPEEWCVAKKTPAWLFAAAEALHRWIRSGVQLTEAEYDDAIRAAAQMPLR
jgi:acyl transferase domain-containing protein